jgi:hypothetical protein
MDRHNYTYSLLESVDKKIKPEYVKVRAAKSGDKPPIIISIPRPIADKMDIEVGDTFAMFTEGKEKIILVKATI